MITIEVRAIVELIRNPIYGDDIMTILAGLSGFMIQEKVTGCGNVGLPLAIANEHFAADAMEMLFAANAIEEVDGRVRLTELGFEAIKPGIHPSLLTNAGPGALAPEESDNLSAIERSDIVRLKEICKTNGVVGSFAELFFVALVETQLSTLKDARVVHVIEQTPTSVKDDAWTLLHDAGFIDPVDGCWEVSQRGLTAYFNYTH